MIRGITGSILWICLAIIVGLGLFAIKYQAKDLENQLASINREIVRNREEIHVLNAEWSYLNDPARLREMSIRLLVMQPLAPAQIATLDTLGTPPMGRQSALPALAAMPETQDVESRRQTAKVDDGRSLPASAKTPPPSRPRRPGSAQVATAADEIGGVGREAP